MDPSDQVWDDYFNEEELQEIRSFRAPEIPELPTELQEFLNSFKGKVSYSRTGDLVVLSSNFFLLDRP